MSVPVRRTAWRQGVAVAALVVWGCAPAAGPVETGLATSADAPAESVLRFVVVGDTGKGNEIQRSIGNGIARTCARLGGCSFGLLVGDNIYPSGGRSNDDDQLRTKFDEPFAAVAFPFHVALGNHDYGANGAGWDYWRASYEIAWSARSPRWSLPARHYAFTGAHADFFALDTNAIFWGYDKDQVEALALRRAASSRPWKIAFGHHPYLSNGKHGDAGHNDGLPSWMPGSASRWRDFFDAHLCGRFDLYFAGHDHNQQDLGEACGVQLFVSGSGSSPKKVLRPERGPFNSDAAGFLVVELTATAATVRVYDAADHELHARTIRK